MTIYKTQAKTEEKKDLVDLEAPVDVVSVKIPNSAHATVRLQRRRRSPCAVVTVALVSLLIIACALGGVLWYFKLRPRTIGRCGVRYDPSIGYQRDGTDGNGNTDGDYLIDNGGLTAPEPGRPKPVYTTFVEKISFEVYPKVERISVPKYDSEDEVQFTVDFNVNMTAIRDATDKVCYIIDMEDAPMQHWEELRERIEADPTYEVQMNAGVIQRTFKVVRPAVAVDDTVELGRVIPEDCAPFPIYMLQKLQPILRGTITTSRTYAQYPGGRMMHEYVVMN